MSAREEIAYHLWTAVPGEDNAGAKARAEEMLDAHRAEVLAEAKVEVVAWLVKKAREGTPIEQLASKAARGAIRPDNLRMLPATFFEAGRTYRLGARHTFRCTDIDSNPGTGERHAIGWAYDSHTDRWRVTDMDSFSWHGGWVDVTEAGEPA